ncbi:hypothetical protein [Streptomyces aureus]|uniref:hypothetical protein n=1 Tax=Streptomyces aureus TaxID=193461 RepID=UPI000B2988A2|nr:hypothetical protein [Streptomyces aureus]
MDLPDDLINLERDAEEARARMAGLADAEHNAQWKRWREASAAVQGAITAHAKATGENRMSVEMAVKKAVRHETEDPAE